METAIVTTNRMKILCGQDANQFELMSAILATSSAGFLPHFGTFPVFAHTLPLAVDIKWS
jgi:hypothetical protein